MARPSTIARWARTIGGVVSPYIATPSSTRLDEGWRAGKRPPAEYMNWWMGLVYDWITWLTAEHDKDTITLNIPPQYIRNLGTGASGWETQSDGTITCPSGGSIGDIGLPLHDQAKITAISVWRKGNSAANLTVDLMRHTAAHPISAASVATVTATAPNATWAKSAVAVGAGVTLAAEQSAFLRYTSSATGIAIGQALVTYERTRA